MVRYLAGLVLACGLIGCERPAAPQPETTEQPLEVAPAPLPRLTPAVHREEPPVSPQGVAFVVAFEVVSPAYYRRYLVRPIWPQGASGATVGIGYDLGYQIAPVIRADWQAHARVEALAAAAGVKGEAARALVARMRDVETGYPLAEQVFREAVVPRYWRATTRAFPGVEDLRPGARDALFSVIFNRGTAMAGDRRAEMRVIRDACIPAADYQCIAEAILAMRRIWVGTAIEGGMNRRRQGEAELVLAEVAA